MSRYDRMEEKRIALLPYDKERMEKWKNVRV